MTSDQEHTWLSNILKITLDKNETEKFFLSALYDSLSSNETQNDSIRLNRDQMDTAMMERLGLVGVHNLEHYNKNNIGSGLVYLYGVYDNILTHHEKNALSVLHKSCYSDEILNYCKELVLQYSVTFLTEPDIFINGENRLLQLTRILEKSRVIPYLNDIRSLVQQDPNNVELFSLILTVLGKRLDVSCFEANIFDPFYMSAANIILMFTEEEFTLKILTNHELWFGFCSQSKTLTGTLVEQTTLMGKLLQSSVFTRSKDSVLVHFQNINNFRDISSTANSLQEQSKKLLLKCALIFKRILAKKNYYNKVLVWFLLAVDGNIKRNQLGVLLQRDPVNFFSSGGFSINVVHLALMIFEPMSNDYIKFCNKMDFTYCIRKHVYNGGNLYGNFELCLSEESTMLPRSPETEQRILSSPNQKPTFFTEWTFLCSRLIQAMYIPLYNEFIQSMNNYDQDPGGENWSQQQQEQLLLLNFAKKTVIADPSLKQLILKYCAAFSVYVLEKIDFHIIPSLQPHPNEALNPSTQKIQTHFKISKNKEEAPNVTYCMPDSFVEDIATLTEFVCDEYSIECDELIQPIIIFISTMMGNTNLIQNPHRRAKMAKTLSYLNKVPVVGTFGREFVSFIEKTLDTRSPASQLLIKIFPKNLIHIFIDIEFTGRAGAFFQKFAYRHVMYMLIKLIVKTPLLLERLKEIGIKSEKCDGSELPLFLRFINLLTNDATYLLDEALSYIAKIKEIENLKNSNGWLDLSAEDKELKMKQFDEAVDRATSYNTISFGTVKALKRITTHIKGPFLTNAMKDKLAAMLNYFYFQLVSNKQSNLKVRNMSQIKFDPKKLLKIISVIYSNFENEPIFVEAVANDQRSYSPALFVKAISILKKVQCSFQLIKSIESIGERSKKIYQLNKSSEFDLDDCPEEFLDIISCEIMKDPVQLPSSHVILDRSTITRQLLSAEEDPFNRAHLTIDMVIPQPELKSRIDDWIANKLNKPQKNQNSSPSAPE